jgi:hypothetical protein
MVTITGALASLATNIFGVAGIAGATLELRAVHTDPTIRPGYSFGSVVVAERPLVVPLTAGGLIPAATQILASAVLRPAGSFHRATWRIPASSAGPAEIISYDLTIGPDGGTCDITDPTLRIGAGSAPVLAGWPDTPPVAVYSSMGAP